MNRFREGLVTDDDKKVLSSRITHEEHLDVNALHIFYTNYEVSEHNSKMLNRLDSPSILIKARKRGPKNYFAEVSKDGRIANTQFFNELEIKIGARCALTWNLSTMDGLVNGSSGKVIGIEVNKLSAEKKVEAIIVRFDDKNAGLAQRQKYSRLSKKYQNQNGTPIFMFEHEHNITSRKGFKQAAVAIIEQFPLRINYASTAHKVQGQTIKAGSKVVIHWNKNMSREKGMSYVMLGRTQTIDDLYIAGNVDFAAIQCSAIALEESKRLLTLFDKEKSQNEEFKGNHWMISYLNIRSLKAHFGDVKNDNYLMEADVMTFGETWLDDGEAVEIGGFASSFVSNGRGKGIAAYSKMIEKTPNVSFKSDHYSVIKISTLHFDVFALYLSQNANLEELCQIMESVIVTEKASIIMGDMNMKDDSKNAFITLLHSRQFKQIVEGATFDKGSLIDHIYINKEIEKTGFKVERQSVYYSDHEIITLFVAKSTEESIIDG